LHTLNKNTFKLLCLHVWMDGWKISCELTGSLSLNKVFELNLNGLSCEA